MTNYYVRTDFVPERNKDIFTEGKIYKVKNKGKHGGEINGENSPTGRASYILFTLRCSYLDHKKNWELLEGISHNELISLISSTKNSIISVKFIKKDGTIRKLTGMFGVKKHLRHKDRKPTVDTDKYFILFDMIKKEYRAVNKETIFEAKIKGKTYIVKTENLT